MLGERLRRSAAELSGEWARERWARHRGEGARGLAGVLGRHGLAMDGEGYREAREGREKAVEGSDEALRARAVESFCARALLGGHAASFLDNVLAEELSAAVVIDRESIPWRDLAFRIVSEGMRERRAVLAREQVSVLPRFESPLRRAAEARGELAVSLGFANEALFLASADGFDAAALVEEARATLAATADAFGDLSNFLRRREGASPPGKSRPEWHDLLRAIRVSSLDSHFGNDALRLAHAAVAELGLESGWDRITWDADRRERRGDGAMVAPVGPPFDVEVSIRLDRGAPTCVLALQSAGEALAFASVDAERDGDDRRLLDPAWVSAMGRLVVSALASPLWHRRTFQATSTASIEAARAGAVILLHDLRLDCCGVILGEALAKEGPGSLVREMHDDLLPKATFSRWPTERWMVDASRFAEASASLRGASLAGQLTLGLRNRFNEDWWRNPAAGKFLAGECSKASSLDAAALATSLSGQKPSLARAAEHLVTAAAV